MDKDLIIKNTINFVKQELTNAEGGHDWFHIERVYKNVQLILKEEKADAFVVCLTALLHDIADAKFFNGDETIGPKKAAAFLTSQDIDVAIIEKITSIIQHMSFKNSFENENSISKSIEFQIVQDADRLDAIGAIGIARCFTYGGFKKRVLYDPEIAPNLTMTKEEYKKSEAPTINHFYEKLLLLKDKMHTKTAKRIAQKRHEFMVGFLNEFFNEWEGKS